MSWSNILADFFYFFIILELCKIFFAYKIRKHNISWITNVGISLFLILVSTWFSVLHLPIVELIAQCLVVIFLLLFLYNEKIIKIVITSLWLIFAISMIAILNKVLINVIFEILNINISELSAFIISVSSYLVVLALGKIYKKYTFYGITSLKLVNLVCFTILLVIDSLVVSVIDYANVVSNMEHFQNLYLVAVIFVILGIFIQLGAVIFLFMQRNVYKEKKQITEKYLEEQKNYYEYLENREKETKKFRHDLRSHMEFISGLARKREYDQIADYLTQMDIKISEFGNNVTVHNGIVDAILNQYCEKARKKGIEIAVKGRLPEHYAIDAYDSCTIFSNVLSNALEAAVKTEEKYISVECRYNDKNIIIVVKNSVVCEKEGSLLPLKSGKANSDYHGFGLENVKESIVKYDGLMDIECLDGLFVLTIVFKNTEKI